MSFCYCQDLAQAVTNQVNVVNLHSDMGAIQSLVNHSVENILHEAINNTFDLSSLSHDYLASSIASFHNIDLRLGQQLLPIDRASTLTPAEYLLTKEILSNSSDILVLNNSGQATGGSFNFSQLPLNTHGLIIPANVTAYLSNSQNYNLAGNLVNYGDLNVNSSSYDLNLNSLYNATNAQININLNNISATYNIRAENEFINSGSILAINNLNISTIHGDISNLNDSNISALGNLTLNTGSGNINNFGSVVSESGNINLLSTCPNLNLNAIGGNFSATDNINILNSDATQISMTGGNYSGRNLNINSDTLNGLVNSITGQVNETGNSAHLITSSKNLILGNINLKGDPTYVNTQGDILLNGAISTNGNNLAILASGNILVTAASADVTINTQSSTQSSGTVTLIAGLGSNLTVTTAANTSGVPSPGASIPSGDTATVTIGNSQGGYSGGSIDLISNNTLTSGSTVINTSGSSGNLNGGDVILMAFTNGSSGGQVLLANSNSNYSITTNASGTGINGAVTIFATASSGNAIDLGSINTGTSLNNNGSILIVSGYSINEYTFVFDSTGTIIGNNTVYGEPDSSRPGNIVLQGNLVSTSGSIDVETAGNIIYPAANSFQTNTSLTIYEGTGSFGSATNPVLLNAQSLSLSAIGGNVFVNDSASNVQINNGSFAATGIYSIDASSTNGNLSVNNKVVEQGGSSAIGSIILTTNGTGSIGTNGSSIEVLQSGTVTLNSNNITGNVWAYQTFINGINQGTASLNIDAYGGKIVFTTSNLANLSIYTGDNIEFNQSSIFSGNVLLSSTGGNIYINENLTAVTVDLIASGDSTVLTTNNAIITANVLEINNPNSINMMNEFYGSIGNESNYLMVSAPVIKGSFSGGIFINDNTPNLNFYLTTGTYTPNVDIINSNSTTGNIYLEQALSTGSTNSSILFTAGKNGSILIDPNSPIASGIYLYSDTINLSAPGGNIGTQALPITLNAPSVTVKSGLTNPNSSVYIDVIASYNNLNVNSNNYSAGINGTLSISSKNILISSSIQAGTIDLVSSGYISDASSNDVLIANSINLNSNTLGSPNIPIFINSANLTLSVSSQANSFIYYLSNESNLVNLSGLNYIGGGLLNLTMTNLQSGSINLLGSINLGGNYTPTSINLTASGFGSIYQQSTSYILDAGSINFKLQSGNIGAQNQPFNIDSNNLSVVASSGLVNINDSSPNSLVITNLNINNQASVEISCQSGLVLSNNILASFTQASFSSSVIDIDSNTNLFFSNVSFNTPVLNNYGNIDSAVISVNASKTLNYNGTGSIYAYNFNLSSNGNIELNNLFNNGNNFYVQSLNIDSSFLGNVYTNATSIGVEPNMLNHQGGVITVTTNEIIDGNNLTFNANGSNQGLVTGINLFFNTANTLVIGTGANQFQFIANDGSVNIATNGPVVANSGSIYTGAAGTINLNMVSSQPFNIGSISSGNGSNGPLNAYNLIVNNLGGGIYDSVNINSTNVSLSANLNAYIQIATSIGNSYGVTTLNASGSGIIQELNSSTITGNRINLISQSGVLGGSNFVVNANQLFINTNSSAFISNIANGSVLISSFAGNELVLNSYGNLYISGSTTAGIIALDTVANNGSIFIDGNLGSNLTSSVYLTATGSGVINSLGNNFTVAGTNLYLTNSTGSIGNNPITIFSQNLSVSTQNSASIVNNINDIYNLVNINVGGAFNLTSANTFLAPSMIRAQSLNLNNSLGGGATFANQFTTDATFISGNSGYGFNITDLSAQPITIGNLIGGSFTITSNSSILLTGTLGVATPLSQFNGSANLIITINNSGNLNTSGNGILNANDINITLKNGSVGNLNPFNMNNYSLLIQNLYLNVSGSVNLFSTDTISISNAVVGGSLTARANDLSLGSTTTNSNDLSSVFGNINLTGNTFTYIDGTIVANNGSIIINTIQPAGDYTGDGIVLSNGTSITASSNNPNLGNVQLYIGNSVEPLYTTNPLPSLVTVNNSGGGMVYFANQGIFAFSDSNTLNASGRNIILSVPSNSYGVVLNGNDTITADPPSVSSVALIASYPNVNINNFNLVNTSYPVLSNLTVNSASVNNNINLGDLNNINGYSTFLNTQLPINSSVNYYDSDNSIADINNRFYYLPIEFQDKQLNFHSQIFFQSFSLLNQAFKLNNFIYPIVYRSNAEYFQIKDKVNILSNSGRGNLTLVNGFYLLNSKHDIKIMPDLQFPINFNIKAKSVVLIIKDVNSICLYNLYDTAQNSIFVSSSNDSNQKIVRLNPGQSLFITAKKSLGLAKLNQISKVGYRNMTQFEKYGLKMYKSDYSIISLISSVDKLKNVFLGDKKYSHLTNQIVKTAATVMQTSLAYGNYSQIR